MAPTLHICLKASDLAAAAGLHPYRPQPVQLLSVLQKLHPELCAKAEAHAGPSAGLCRLARASVQALAPEQTAALASKEDPRERAAAIDSTRATVAAELDARIAARTKQAVGKALVEAAVAKTVPEIARLAVEAASIGGGGEAQHKVQRRTESIVRKALSKGLPCEAAASMVAAQTLDHADLPSAVREAIADRTREVLARDALPVIRVAKKVAKAAAEPGATADTVKAAVPEAAAAVVAKAAACIPDQDQVAACKALAGKELSSKVACTRGSRDEPGALQAAAVAAKQAVVLSNATMYAATLQLEGATVRVVGKVDGWLEDLSAIVEVKNRQRRLFCSVPDYERVQVLAYMFITGARSCRFTERLGSDSWTTELAWDEQMWQGTVVPGLQDFASKLGELVDSEDARIALAAAVA